MKTPNIISTFKQSRDVASGVPLSVEQLAKIIDLCMPTFIFSHYLKH